MRISSFDIFDTCLLRKCGTPENFFDVFSLCVFKGEVEERIRHEFVAARRIAEEHARARDTYYTLQDIWNAFAWAHPMLKPIDELCQMEQDLEHEVLAPVIKMRNKVNECRKHGDKIIFISDMYLSSVFLIYIMREHGFYQDGDGLYVSCECKAEKWNGDLFKYVQEKEGLKSFHHWHHYGDNKLADYRSPKKLDIRCTLINHEYTPYQKELFYENNTPNNRVAEILAGANRFLHHTLPDSTHKDFLLDVVAPLFIAFTYRVLQDAYKNEIKRLYFCARDTNLIYRIAQKISPMFAGLSIHYLYISRESLYNGDQCARMKYFEQCGLSSQNEKCAIVDLRTSGKTLCELNKQLCTAGYGEVKGYFFEVFCTGTMDNAPANYYAELNTLYYTQIESCKRIFSSYALVESYISVHNEKRTINYVEQDNRVEPVFANKETEVAEDVTIMTNQHERCEEHRKTLMACVDTYMQVGLFQQMDEVWRIAMHTWVNFNHFPPKYYLCALTDFYTCKPNTDKILPYVKKMNMFELLTTRGRQTIWKQASIIYSLPDMLIKLYSNRRK